MRAPHEPSDEVGRLRVTPHSVEAEQSVLGALLADNAAFDQVADVLRAEAFYARDHGLIFGAVAELVAAGKPADVVTVFERLQVRGEADAAGGLAYLNGLAQGVASARHARQYAAIVAERWRARQLIALSDETANAAFAGSAVEAVVDRAVTGMLRLAGADARDEPAALDALLGPWVDQLSAMAEGNAVPAIETGLADLDRLTSGGIWRGELWVIGARPSMGKSAMSLTLARNIGARHSVLFLSQEDSRRTLVARLVAAAGRVGLHHLRNPVRAPQDAWNGVTDGVDALSRLRIRIDDQPSLRLADVRRKIQQVKRRGPLDVVFVDYLQLMQGDAETRNRELGDIANGLKAAAKDFDIGIVLLSQLNRSADQRTGPPQMSDLRESGDIEGAADLIGLLHREVMRKPTEANKHFAELHVCKQKNGPTDTVALYFDGAFQRFGNWEGQRPGPPGAAAGRRGMD